MAQASPNFAVQLRVLGAKMARVPVDETAIAHRTQPYVLAIIGHWSEGADGTRPTAWVEGLFDQVRPYGSRVYVNFLQNEPDGIKDAYPPETYRRLARSSAATTRRTSSRRTKT
jgi:hypothetical protein